MTKIWIATKKREKQIHIFSYYTYNQELKKIKESTTKFFTDFVKLVDYKGEPIALTSKNLENLVTGETMELPSHFDGRIEAACTIKDRIEEDRFFLYVKGFTTNQKISKITLNNGNIEAEDYVTWPNRIHRNWAECQDLESYIGQPFGFFAWVTSAMYYSKRSAFGVMDVNGGPLAYRLRRFTDIVGTRRGTLTKHKVDRRTKLLVSLHTQSYAYNPNEKIPDYLQKTKKFVESRNEIKTKQVTKETATCRHFLGTKIGGDLIQIPAYTAVYDFDEEDPIAVLPPCLRVFSDKTDLYYPEGDKLYKIGEDYPVVDTGGEPIVGVLFQN